MVHLASSFPLFLLKLTTNPPRFMNVGVDCCIMVDVLSECMFLLNRGMCF